MRRGLQNSKESYRKRTCVSDSAGYPSTQPKTY
nr:MAG TPA: hypothetical protein [Caudoviricetes sp.]